MATPIRQPLNRSAPLRSGDPYALTLTRLTITSVGEAITFQGLGSYMAWWDTAVPPVRKGYIQGYQTDLIINAEGHGPSGETLRGIRLIASRDVSVEAPLGISGSNKLYWPSQSISSGVWMQDGTWVRVAPNLYTGGILGGNGGISGGGAGGGMGGYTGGYFPGTVGCGSSVAIGTSLGVGTTLNVGSTASFSASVYANGNIRSYRNGGGAGSGATDAMYYNATFYAAPADIYGASTASISFHPSGIAPQLRVGVGVDTIYVHNSSGAANISVLSGVLVNTSSRRYKTNIASWPERNLGAGTPDATDLISQMRVVSFECGVPSKLWEIPASVRRQKAYQRLNDYAARTGKPQYELPDHDCDVDPCNGTRDEPCARVLNVEHKSFGLIAEELVEIMPEAVTFDAERQPEAINFAQVTAVAVAAIQELTERVKILEGAA